MARDEDVGEGHQPGEHLVVDDLARKVAEEQVALLLVDVERHAAHLPALERGDQRRRIHQRAVLTSTSPGRARSSIAASIRW